MKWPQTTEGWLLIWTPIILAAKKAFVPDLDVPDESLVTVITGIVIWILSRLSKKEVVKRTNGGATV